MRFNHGRGIHREKILILRPNSPYYSNNSEATIVALEDESDIAGARRTARTSRTEIQSEH